MRGKECSFEITIFFKEFQFREHRFHSGTTIKDSWTKAKERVESGDRGGDGCWGGVEGDKCRQLYLNNNKTINNNNKFKK